MVPVCQDFGERKKIRFMFNKNVVGVPYLYYVSTSIYVLRCVTLIVWESPTTT